MNPFHPCLFGHARDWTRVIVDGIWYRACSRCQTPTTAILVNSEGKDIVPAKVPPIVPLKAVRVKVRRQRKPRLVAAKVIGKIQERA